MPKLPRARTVAALFVVCAFAGPAAAAGAAAPDAGQILATLAAQMPGIVSATATPSKTATPGTDLVIRVAAQKGTPTPAATWKAAIVAAAARSQYLAAGLSPVKALDVRRVFPDGTEERLGGGLGKAPAQEVFADVTPELLRSIEERSLAAGLTNVSVTTVRGLQEAIVVTGQSTDVKAAVKTLGGLFGLLGQAPNAFEGAYLEVNDSSGAPAYTYAVATRGAVSMQSSLPELGLGYNNEGYLVTPARISPIRRAEVTSLAGDVTFSRGAGQPFDRLKRWTSLQAGYRFATGSGGSVTFALAHSPNPRYGHDTLVVHPATRLRVNAFRRDGNVAKARLSLTAGTIRAKVSRAGIPGELIVVTRGCEVTLTDGTAVVSVAKDGTTAVYAVSRQVKVAGSGDSAPVVVRQGRVALIAPDRKVTAPRRFASADLPTAG